MRPPLPWGFEPVASSWPAWKTTTVTELCSLYSSVTRPTFFDTLQLRTRSSFGGSSSCNLRGIDETDEVSVYLGRLDRHYRRREWENAVCPINSLNYVVVSNARRCDTCLQRRIWSLCYACFAWRQVCWCTGMGRNH